MDLSINYTCAISTAIISVLIYMFMISMLSAPNMLGIDTGKSIETNVEWYKSLEVIMLVSIFIGFNINKNLPYWC
jgi:hypothetical protein